MFRPTALILTASAGLLLGGGAWADEPTSTDVRCLVVSFALTQSQDEKTKQIGGAAFAYYLGRLDGRTPGLDLESELRTAIPQVTASTFMDQLQACGAPLKARFDQLQEIGDRLKSEAGNLPKPGAIPTP